MFIDHPVCLHPNSLLNVYYIHINFHSIHFPKARTNPSRKNTKYLQTFSQVDWYEEDVDQRFAFKKTNPLDVRYCWISQWCPNSTMNNVTIFFQRKKAFLTTSWIFYSDGLLFLCIMAKINAHALIANIPVDKCHWRTRRAILKHFIVYIS